MTEVEALLAVDKGRVPPNTLAFFAREPDFLERRTYAALAIIAAAAAIAAILGGAQRPLVAIMLIATTALVILCMPTQQAEEEQPQKRHVLVVTPSGIIVRDAWGVRCWSFENLCEALIWSHEHRPQVVLVERNGTRHAVDYLGFNRGEHLRDVLLNRVKSQV
jgi:hypothetical protein